MVSVKPSVSFQYQFHLQWWSRLDNNSNQGQYVQMALPAHFAASPCTSATYETLILVKSRTNGVFNILFPLITVFKLPWQWMDSLSLLPPLNGELESVALTERTLTDGNKMRQDATTYIISLPSAAGQSLPAHGKRRSHKWKPFPCSWMVRYSPNAHIVHVLVNNCT